MHEVIERIQELKKTQEERSRKCSDGTKKIKMTLNENCSK